MVELARGNVARASALALAALALGAAGCTSAGSGTDAQPPAASVQAVQDPVRIAEACQAELRAVLKDNFGDPEFANSPEVANQGASASVTGSVLLTPVEASAGPTEYSYTCTLVPDSAAAPSGWAVPALQLTNTATGVTRNIRNDHPTPDPSES